MARLPVTFRLLSTWPPEMTADTLFSPFKHKTLSLPNRIVMAPMTRGFSPGGVPTAEVTGYYARRAAAEVGLIVSEGTGVGRPSSLNSPNYPRFYGADALAGWQNVIDAVHAAGGKMAPQLWHVGAVPAQKKDGWPLPEDMESPSGLHAPGKNLGQKMSDADIADAIAAFATAAADAKRLGFDAVELHGAHGYLIDQFFWAGTNERGDSYDGPTIGERGLFAAEILKAVRQAVGADYPVILRLSQWKQQDYDARLANSPSEMEAWLKPLVDAGADILHCSQRRFWEPEFADLHPELNFAGWAKKLTGVPTITVGSVGLAGEFLGSFKGEGSEVATLDELLRRLDRGDFDLVGVGRALLQDPQWAVKVHNAQHGELKAFGREAMGSLS